MALWSVQEQDERRDGRYRRVFEQTLLEAPPVTVTTSRLTVAGETYAIGEIANHTPDVKKPRRDFAILAVFTAIALLVVAHSLPNSLPLASAAALCLGWWGTLALLLTKPEHRIVLTMRSGKKAVIARRDAAEVAEIADALSVALRAPQAEFKRRMPRAEAPRAQAATA